LSEGQIIGYIGMSKAFELLGVSAKSRDWAKRGLWQLAEARRRNPAIDKETIPSDAYEIMERQLLASLA
jgi:hypothetical protein